MALLQIYNDLGTPGNPRVPLGGAEKPYPRHLANLQEPGKPVGPGAAYIPLGEPAALCPTLAPLVLSRKALPLHLANLQGTGQPVGRWQHKFSVGLVISSFVPLGAAAAVGPCWCTRTSWGNPHLPLRQLPLPLWHLPLRRSSPGGTAVWLTRRSAAHHTPFPRAAHEQIQRGGLRTKLLPYPITQSCCNARHSMPCCR